MTKLFVGNLSYQTTGDDLNQLFSQHGEVTSASIVMDRETGRSRGFGFVEMPNKEQADAAISSLNEQEFQGRNITVNEARPKSESRGGGGYGGGGNRGGGGYGGGGNRGGGGGYGGNRDRY
jgi:RNA recognition motif-containing protein